MACLGTGGGGVLSLYTLYMSGILWHGGQGVLRHEGGAEARGGADRDSLQLKKQKMWVGYLQPYI